MRWWPVACSMKAPRPSYPAPAGAGGARLARPAGGQPRGAQGPARRRARCGHPGLPEGLRAGELEQAKIESDPKKASFYVAVIERPGKPTTEVIAEIVPEIIRAFPWPKSMRWGAGSLRWVRPLHSIVCTFGTDVEEPEVVRFEVEGIVSSDITRGHRFLAPDAFQVRRLDDWMAKLEAAKVVADRDRRKDIILKRRQGSGSGARAGAGGGRGAARKRSGLVEWPVTLMGTFEERFLSTFPTR